MAAGARTPASRLGSKQPAAGIAASLEVTYSTEISKLKEKSPSDGMNLPNEEDSEGHTAWTEITAGPAVQESKSPPKARQQQRQRNRP